MEQLCGFSIPCFNSFCCCCCFRFLQVEGEGILRGKDKILLAWSLLCSTHSWRTFVDIFLNTLDSQSVASMLKTSILKLTVLHQLLPRDFSGVLSGQQEVLNGRILSKRIQSRSLLKCLLGFQGNSCILIPPNSRYVCHSYSSLLSLLLDKNHTLVFMFPNC